MTPEPTPDHELPLTEAGKALLADLKRLPSQGKIFGAQIAKAERQARAEADARVQRLREALESVGWNENDGKCWCRESPDAGPNFVLPHEERCLYIRAILSALSKSEAGGETR